MSKVPPPIPQFTPARQYKRIGREIEGAVQRVLRSGRYVMGPETEAFEAEAAAYLGVEFFIACASGTDALLLTLRALSLATGAAVITTPFTFFATAATILLAGGVPIFADIDPRTFNVHPQQVRAALEQSIEVAAILPVHLYGRAADIRDVAHAIKPARVPIIEDAAQAFGAGVPRQSTAMAGAAHNIPLTRAGTVGIAGCFSFYPTKNLGAMGEGGAVATNNAALAERLRLLRAQGSRTRYMHELLGWNARMHEIQAAILRVKLRYVDDWNARRMRIARSYEEQLLASGIAELASQTDFSKPSPLVLPDRVAGHSFHQYVIRAQDRDGLREFLKTRGIGTEVYYPVPAHFQPAMQARLSRDSFPQAERAAREVLALPMFPELTDREVERVTTALCSFFETKRSKE